MPVDIAFLDVGQGDCTVLHFWDPAQPGADVSVLIDCGSTKGGSVTGSLVEKRVREYIAASGGRLNHLILTHPDIDHYNLLAQVLGDGSADAKLDVPIDTILYTGQPANYGTDSGAAPSRFVYRLLTNSPKISKTAGQPPLATAPVRATMPAKLGTPLVEHGGAKLYLIAAHAVSGGPSDAKRAKTLGKRAAKRPAEDPNANSVVLYLEGKSAGGKCQKVFLMGDATIDTEKAIALVFPPGAQDPFARTGRTWLKLGHHGSATSSSDTWIKRLAPDGIFISSDCKSFSGTGTPRAQVIRDIGTWAPEVLKDRLPEHGYVAFESTSGEPNFRKFFTTRTKATICTSLYSYKYDSAKKLESSEGWYWYLNLDADGANTFTIESA
ncbi:ComEC/Rec2 family competence protein [Nocardia sp. NPDC001965]